MLEEENNELQPEGKRDYSVRIYVILLLVMLGLLMLYIIPSQIGSWWDIKPIDMLSDLRTTTEQSSLETGSLVTEAGDEVALPKPKVQRQQEKKRERNEQVFQKIAANASKGEEQMTPFIVDYSPDRMGLKHFFTQLRRRSSLGRPVRIAVLGDSFVEADIFTDAIRLGLQDQFGGGGVGLMGMASGVAGYRQSIRHEQRAWVDISLMDKGGRKHTLLGHLFEPKGGAWASYRVPSGGRPFDEATLYYYSPSGTSLSVDVTSETKEVELEETDTPLSSRTLYRGSEVEQLKLSQSSLPSGFVSYGIALERSEGISLDNMSLRGSSGLHLAGLDAELNRAFAKVRPYDLIILQYGLNVANAKQKNYKGYAAKMHKSILHLRELYPEADVMLMGVSDRAQRAAGELRTMAAIELLEIEQRAVAESLGLTYFSLLDAMRSLGGVVEMSRRGEVSKDYTHLSHKGGKRLASVFLAALALEKDYYDKIHH